MGNRILVLATLIAAAALAACASGGDGAGGDDAAPTGPGTPPAGDAGTAEAAPTEDASAARPGEAGSDDADAAGDDATPQVDAPAPTDAGATLFACGPQSCSAPTQYCEEQIQSINKRIWTCQPSPGSCNGTPSCACVEASKPCPLGFSTCHDDAGAVLVLCSGGQL